MLAETKVLLQKACRKHYAIGHFNVNDLEAVQAVTAAASKLKSPVILATSEGAIHYAGMKYLYEIVRAASEINPVPIALHLDHGQNLEIIREAIRRGYSSVMIDASHDPFEKNIWRTKQVVQLAHKKGISVEAELGTIGGVEDAVSSRKIIYTEPGEAQEFVEKTGCDFLAVAIGTSHGAYKFKGKAKLNLSLLKEIKKSVKTPLVLHGASGVPENLVRLAEKYGAKLSGVQGVPDSQVKKAVSFGICKVNTDTDLRLAFDAGIRQFLKKEPRDFDPRHILGPARDLAQKVAEQRIKLFGSVGKA